MYIVVYIAYAPPSIVGFKISYQARGKFSIKDDNYNKTRDSTLNKLKIQIVRKMLLTRNKRKEAAISIVDKMIKNHEFTL